jgi:hypothetical protein
MRDRALLVRLKIHATYSFVTLYPRTPAMRLLLISAALTAFALPALADDTTGTVVAYDRVSHVIVLDDRSIWEVPADFALPTDLIAGDRILIDYQSNGDNGVGKFLSITRVEG